MKKTLSLDIFNINKNKNVTWPIEEKSFKKLSQIILDNYLVLIKKNKKLVKLFQSETSFINTLIQIYHIQIIKKLSIKNKFKIINGKYSKPFYDIENKLFTFKKLSIPQLFKIIIKSFLFTVKSNNIKNYFFLLKNRKSLCIGKPTRSVFEYLKRKKTFLIVVDIFQIDTNIKGNLNNSLIQNINNFFDNIDKEIKNYFSIEISSKKIKKNYLKRLNIIKQNIYKNNSLNFDYIFTNSSKPINKIFSLKHKNKNNKLCAQEHGNNRFSIINNYLPILYSGFDIFLCPNLTSKKNFEKLTNLNKHLKSTLPKSINVNLKIMKQNLLEKKINKNNLKILLVGYPMSPIRSPIAPESFFYFKYYFELNILKLFKNYNYSLDYKIHPDRLGWENSIKKYVNKIVYDNFEKIYSNYDLVLFSYSHTSTFNYILKTNLPCIIFNTDLGVWNKNDLKFLKKRCQIKNLSSNKFNISSSPLLDFKDFQKMLESAIKKKNNNDYFQKIVK